MLSSTDTHQGFDEVALETTYVRVGLVRGQLFAAPEVSDRFGRTVGAQQVSAL